MIADLHTEEIRMTFDREDRDYEFNAREDYISELMFEHFDPCAGHEDDDLFVPSIRGDVSWEEDDIEF